jgi:hypothetical protein
MRAIQTHSLFSGMYFKSLSFLLILALCLDSAFGAGGLFPKMPQAPAVHLVDVQRDDGQARLSAFALEGMINQSAAESYLISRPLDQDQVRLSNRSMDRLPLPGGANPGLRALFKSYSGRVKKMFLYDPTKDWTFDLALMAAAQQKGIPVTKEIASSLSKEFGWKGEVQDFTSLGHNRIDGFEWALTHLMPGCSRKVIFVVQPHGDIPLFDYAVASKGFTFWLDFKNPEELAEVKRIFATEGYTVGTSLMGYANSGDQANEFANKYGIGYVVSDFYANGSFWSSFPNKTYHQETGHPVQAVPGKVYVSLVWSDGDNIQFDQAGLFKLWSDPNRGTVPVATTMSPALQELNSPLLDWYYAKLTPNDELIAGPSGVQFIYGRDYKDDLYPQWLELNKMWLRDAGFHSAAVWVMPYPCEKYRSYLKTCGLAGVFHNYNHTGLRYDTGVPVVDAGGSHRSDSIEEDVYEALAKQMPRSEAPVFISWSCIVESFNKGPDGGYTKIKRIIERLNKEYPGRFVFLLPRDFFATIKQYYHLPS